MRTITKDELDIILEKHKSYLLGVDGDGDAVRRARKDGFRLLPSKLYKRIPKSFTDSECVLPNTWLDTPSNRRMIETLREQKKAYGER